MADTPLPPELKGLDPGELQRQQTSGTVLVKESVKVDWANKSAALRKALDAQYARYRDALRKGGN